MSDDHTNEPQSNPIIIPDGYPSIKHSVEPITPWPAPPPPSPQPSTQQPTTPSEGQQSEG